MRKSTFITAILVAVSFCNLFAKDWVINNGPGPVMTSDPTGSGRVCTHPLIVGNKFYLIEPDGASAGSNSLTPAVVTTRSITDGTELSRFTTPIVRTGFQRSNAGSMDTDYVCGVFWGLTTNNTILATNGGDFSAFCSFDADTGVAKAIPGLTAPIWKYGPNSSAAFTSHPDIPYLVVGGSANHSHIGENANIHRILTSNSVPYAGFKHFNEGLADPINKAAYKLDDHSRYAPGVPGFRLWGINLNKGGVGCNVLNYLPYNAFGSDGNARPKPSLVMSDGRIVILCSKGIAQQPFTGTFTKNTLNDYSESRLIIVSPTPLNRLQSIAGFTSWWELPYVVGPKVNYTDNGFTNPQLKLAGENKVVVFFPPRESFDGFLAVYDLTSGLVWSKSIKDQIYEQYKYDNWPRYLDLALGCSNNIVTISKHIPGSLSIQQFKVEDGTTLQSKSVAVSSLEADTMTNSTKKFTTVQSVQTISDGLIHSVLYKKGGRLHQSIVKVDIGPTAVNPTPVEPIPTPTIPTAYQEVLDYAKTRLPADKYLQLETLLK